MIIPSDSAVCLVYSIKAALESRMNGGGRWSSSSSPNEIGWQ